MKLNFNKTEIDHIVKEFDYNGDGLIDWLEFERGMSLEKKGISAAQLKMHQRTKCKIGKIRELMYCFMISPKDAFRYYDDERSGRLMYSQFTQLIMKLFECAQEESPTYPIIKDLFDEIDNKKDGILDY